MKSILKIIIEKKLWILAKLTLKKHRPKIIGITGSVGKTSTKEAIYLALKKRFKVRQNIKNYNNEIGVPLTILGFASAGKSILGWLKIFFLSIVRLLFSKDYPEILIIEMGVDRPGDIDYLVSLVKPDVSVLTAVSDIPVHVKFFKNVEKLAEEKQKLIKALSPDGTAVLNYDNKYSRKSKSKTKAKAITFGLSEKADLWAENISLNPNVFSEIESKPKGLSFKLHYQKTTLPIRLPHILAKHQIYAVLAAVAVGLAFDLNLVEITQNLKEFHPPLGRMNLIKGIKNTYIIDDSYNSSPDATIAALDVLKELNTPSKKIAVLGDMLELGQYTEEGHRIVGKQIPKTADILVTIGNKAEFIADEAKKRGLPKEKIFKFSKSEEAGKFIQNKILGEQDLVLIKGSQSIRTEKVVKELMAEPKKAKKLLVRQEDRWAFK